MALESSVQPETFESRLLDKLEFRWIQHHTIAWNTNLIHCEDSCIWIELSGCSRSASSRCGCNRSASGRSGGNTTGRSGGRTSWLPAKNSQNAIATHIKHQSPLYLQTFPYIPKTIWIAFPKILRKKQSSRLATKKDFRKGQIVSKSLHLDFSSTYSCLCVIIRNPYLPLCLSPDLHRYASKACLMSPADNCFRCPTRLVAELGTVLK